MPVEETMFFNKLGEIPLVNDGWSTATGYYSKLKDYNALMHLALTMAESSVKVAGHMSTPVLNHYQPQIDNINDYACKKLDELENKYPSIKQPTEQWKETCTGYVEPVVGQVKPVITQVQGIVSNGKQKIVNIKTASKNMVEGAKNMGVGTATHVFNATFETVPGRFVSRTVDSALDMADGLVDRYLPEEKEEMAEKNCSDDESDSEDNGSVHAVEEMQEMDPTPKRVLIHANCVTEKIRKRMFRRAVKDLTYAKARTASALIRMQKTVTLIDYAKVNVGTMKEKVDDMWTEIVKESDPSMKEKTVFAGTVEDRIVALGRIVAQQVRSNVTTFEKVISELGEFQKNPISKTKEYKDLIETFLTVESIQNFSSQNLAKATESLKYIQNMIHSVVTNVTSLNWVTMDIDMEDIPLEDNDLGMEQVVSSNNNSEDELEREGNH